jgi:hypothetical protein
LSFDIDLAEGRHLCGFEERSRLAGKEAEAVFPAVEQVLAVVIIDELRGVAIRLEP